VQQLAVKAAGILAIIGAAPLLFLLIFFVFNIDFYIGEHTFFETLPAALYTGLSAGLSLMGGILILKIIRTGAFLVIGGALIGILGGLLQILGIANL
jgi:hypothetical protein